MKPLAIRVRVKYLLTVREGWKVVQGSLSELFFSVSTEDGRGALL